MSQELVLDGEPNGFPDYFPKDCPPSSAKDASGECFRVVAGFPMTEKDFKSYKELDKAKAAPECSRCSLSVYNTLDNAKLALETFPWIGKLISRGQLEPLHGKLSAANPSGHMDWWPYSHVDRRSCFEESAL